MGSDLRKRILFTLLVLVIYRLGTYIPLPGIDSGIIEDFFLKKNNSVFGMLNMFSGGAFQRMSIFALNIMPYITASIIIQLLGSVYKSLENLRKDGEAGRRKLNQYTKLLTLGLGFFQSIAIYYTFSGLEQSAFVNKSQVFLWTTVFSLLSSTMLLMWLGDKITHQGVGNGISLLIFFGIVAELPESIVEIFKLSRSGQYSNTLVCGILLLIVALIMFVVYMERALRNVKVQYSNTRASMMSNGQSTLSQIPLKLNVSGVIPPIFASSIIMFPVMITQFFGKEETVSKISGMLTRGSALYMLLFACGVVFFSFFYSSIVFNTEELSDNLKKSNCFVPGIRPGKSTAEYFQNILNRLTFVGSLYLTFVCIVPDILCAKYSVQLTIGGTSLLSIVSTVIDLVTQVQAHIFSEKYNSVNKRRRIRIR